MICLDEARFVHLDLAAKHLGVRRNAHAYEDAFGLDNFDGARARVFDDQSFDALAAFDGCGFGVVDNCDARILPRLFEPIRARAVSIRTVNERDARADAGEEQTILHC